MAGLTLKETNCKSLLNRAKALTSAAVSLVALFDKESTRLSRMQMVSQLEALRSSVLQQLQTCLEFENAAKYSYSQNDLRISAARLTIGAVIKLASRSSPTISAVGDQLLKKPTATQRPFGGVFVCIDSRDVPGGVEVVSVSRMARESNRAEGVIIGELQGRGQLLFSEREFSLLIDKIIEDIKAGRLRLPLPPEELPEIRYQVVYNPGAEKAD